MKRFAPTATLSLMALGLLLTLATCGTDAPAAKNSNVVWTENYKAALESAKRDNKVVVLHFTGSDWCPPCKALDANVLTSDAFAKWSKDKVLVDLDYPHDKPQSDEVKKQNADLATEYKVEGYPTVILLDSAGKEIGRQVAYNAGQTAEAFIAARDQEIAAKK